MCDELGTERNQNEEETNPTNTRVNNNNKKRVVSIGESHTRMSKGAKAK